MKRAYRVRGLSITPRTYVSKFFCVKYPEFRYLGIYMARKFYRRKRMYRKVPSKRKAIRKAVRTVQAARIKAVIKETLGRQIETKVLQTAGTLNVRPYETAALMSALNFNSTCYCLTPQGSTLGAWTGGGYSILANGVGQDQRIGDEVKIKAMYFNYLLIPQAYNATTNSVPAPQIVLMFFVRPKVRNAFGLASTDILAGPSANFFENQTNTDSGFSGTTLDLLRKVDRDNFEVLAVRRHKIGYAGVLNTSNVVTTLDNNDFKAYHQGRVKIKGFNWKVDRQDVYQGRNIYCFCVAFRADGTGILSTQIPVICNFNHSVYYSDM